MTSTTNELLQKILTRLTEPVPSVKSLNAASYTVLLTDYILLCNVSEGQNMLLILPGAQLVPKGKMYIIKKVDTFSDPEANKVSISPAPGETIDGAALLSFHTPKQSFTICSDGLNWQII